MKKQLSTVYRRELKTLFCAPAGWIFLAVNLLAAGLCTVWLNLRNGYTNYEYALETASLIFCVSIPLLLTLSVSKEGKRGETDMLLRYVSPVTLTLCKYLASLTLMAICTAPSAILPIIFSNFGNLQLAPAYFGVLGYFLTGAALLAMCSYIATTVRKPLLCFAISAVASILLNVSSNLSHVLSSGNNIYFVIFAVILIALITVALFFYFENTLVSVIFASVCSVLTVILTLTDTVAPVVRNIMMLISPQHAFSLLIYGTALPEGIVQPILFTAIFLMITVLRHVNRAGKE
ncbi:MAG: hypothetical protein IJY04_07660 [Clostridia bacterium]|nr:hypothetical protein [Clostridia bacterium]